MDNSQIAYALRGLATEADSQIAERDLETLADALENTANGEMWWAPAAHKTPHSDPAARDNQFKYVTAEYGGNVFEGWAAPKNPETDATVEDSRWAFRTAGSRDMCNETTEDISRAYEDA